MLAQFYHTKDTDSSISLGDKDILPMVRNFVLNSLKLDEQKDFSLISPFEMPWYKSKDRATKYRLGKLWNAKVKDKNGFSRK